MKGAAAGCIPVTPTVKTPIAPDGTLDNRGNPLADAALGDGSAHTEANLTHHGEVVTIFTPGLNLALPISVSAFRCLQGTASRCGQRHVGDPHPEWSDYTGPNPGFVWVMQGAASTSLELTGHAGRNGKICTHPDCPP